MMDMLFERLTQPLFFLRFDFRKSYKLAVQHSLGFSPQNVRQAARHSGAKIQSDGPKNDGHAAGHILASVLANAFDDSQRAAVANGKTFPARPATNSWPEVAP